MVSSLMNSGNTFKTAVRDLSLDDLSSDSDVMIIQETATKAAAPSEPKFYLLNHIEKSNTDNSLCSVQQCFPNSEEKEIRQ